MIRFAQSIVQNLEEALKREWLETNGLGGFAGSTIIGLNTRRYHGLLTAATKPPVGRMMLLSKLEETLVIDHERFELSANRYPGVIHPQGFQYLKEFRLDPFPVFTYEISGLELEKRVFMVHGENTTVIEYYLRPVLGTQTRHCTLEIRPLIGFRDYHSTTHKNDSLNAAVDTAPGAAAITPYKGLPSLHMAYGDGELEVTGYWYDNFEYSEEQARGLDFREDLFNPFVFKLPLTINSGASIIASTSAHDAREAADLREQEIRRRTRIVRSSPSIEPLVRKLVAAADQFIVARGNLETIIAGYHWFSDWGRDTMIALPGLTLVTGRADTARKIMLAFANSLDRGMLPNRFPDAGETPEYNTVDATLWFFEAIRSFLRYTGDFAFVRANLYEKLKDIVEWHLRGTRYGIKVDSDGLLLAGEPGIQLTWMDSKIGDWVVTPRHGKPVEIQALWYNAVRIMEHLANRFGDVVRDTFFRELAMLAQQSFNRSFWNEEAGCLFDVVNRELRDGSIRPNQIFAVSLHNNILAGERARRVVDVVQRELLTPMGLRSLSPKDPQYRPRYEGGVWERDSSYHQGTVWTWLMGPFVSAYIKVNGESMESRTQAARWLNAFEDHMQTAGLGQISEIADAEAAYQPRGCVAQAWSVAELLRCAVEDVFVSNGHGERLNAPAREATACAV